MQSSAKKLLLTYLALMALLLLTVGLSFVPLGAWSGPLSLFVAAMKAALILIIFMKLKTASNSLRILALGSLFWLFALLLLTGSDYLTRV